MYCFECVYEELTESSIKKNLVYKIIKYYLLLFLSFLNKRLFIKHFLFAGIVLFFLFFIWLKFLSLYTLHDKYIQVPNYIGIHISKVDSITSSNKLRYIVIDTIFDKKRSKGIVVNQIPSPFTDVKKQRRIYL